MGNGYNDEHCIVLTLERLWCMRGGKVERKREALSLMRRQKCQVFVILFDNTNQDVGPKGQ